MKRWLRIVIPLSFLLLFGVSEKVSAHVVDEVLTKTAQQDYESLYTLLQRYEGELSGVTFESYSPKWKTIEQLKALELELLNNKHGEELSYLGKIILLPDYPVGKQVLGEYYANYQYTSQKVELLPDRKIYLYGADDFTTVEDVATVLSHEYGHHFSFYYLLNYENKKPGTWMTSKYADERGLDEISKVHDTASGEYKWSIAEIVAEDYVQLLGSENAIKHHLQMNVELPSAFDSTNLQHYWGGVFNEAYAVKPPINIYLKDYKRNPYNSTLYDLQIELQNMSKKDTYLHATDGQGTYVPVFLDTISHVTEVMKWYEYNRLASDQSWILNSSVSDEMVMSAIQHEEEGFNRGSSILRLQYSNIAASITSDDEINQQKYEEAKQYTMLEKKQMLHEVAIQYNIPPEILKAIAFVETGMQQFDDTGNPIITDDGGIGMMQITMSEQELLQKGYDLEKLKWDTRYNIEAGAKILKEKWNLAFLPIINDHNPMVIEDWYFAIMAYNGLSKRNDPSIEQEKDPYQKRVLDVIKKYSLLPISDIPNVNIRYPNATKPDLMSFVDESYLWPSIGTKSSQMFNIGDTVYSWNGQLSYSKLRDNVNGVEIKKLNHYTPLQIVSGPYESANENNQYVMYEVKGRNFTGYTASSNLHDGNITLFSDITSDEVASAVAFLQSENIISGYPDGTFKPNDKLLRRHAAAMLVKELGLTLPEGYKMKAKDMLPGQNGYEAMTIVEAYGLMGQGSDLRPNEYLTRSQMASILVRAYEGVYNSPTEKAAFTDISSTYWNYGAINTLAFNKVTVTVNGPYQPNNNVTRGQFSLFLKRTMDLK